MTIELWFWTRESRVFSAGTGSSFSVVAAICYHRPSGHWKAASAKQVKELAERSLGELNLVAVMIAGVEFHGHTFYPETR